PLSLHCVLAVKYRLQCGLRFFRQMVGLGITRELMRRDVRLEAQHRLRSQGGGVRVAANECCWMPERQVDEVMENQHLAIAIGAGADSDGTLFNLVGDHGCE